MCSPRKSCAFHYKVMLALHYGYISVCWFRSGDYWAKLSSIAGIIYFELGYRLVFFCQV